MLLLSIRLLTLAVLAPPVALRCALETYTLIVGDLGAAFAAHDVATILADVAVLVPGLLTDLVVGIF